MNERLIDLVNDLEADYLNAADDALYELSQKAKDIQMRIRRREAVDADKLADELLELVSLSSKALGAMQFRGWAKATLVSKLP